MYPDGIKEKHLTDVDFTSLSVDVNVLKILGSIHDSVDEDNIKLLNFASELISLILLLKPHNYCNFQGCSSRQENGAVKKAF